MNNERVSELKKRAYLAKQRLRMGYWEKIAGEKRELESGNADARAVAELQRARVGRDELMSVDRDRAKKDEKLYEKVCEILDEDENQTGPIGRLIDKELYVSLSEAGKQKYVLELAEKFRELSRRYYAERANKTYR